ncbi:Clavaminate synthase-like protein [Amniculicola lignicola CBS 123094]|uniref:Clavaminate synthase-like protein n=1 Tax=Amniculicola lignicola CBS 123094 TaxID=1392246 RepID=A0A6A5X2D0_9PLEO|nr:Clavaminate synthase-like protein [Amniculicola lignicola CBS 123094]
MSAISEKSSFESLRSAHSAFSEPDRLTPAVSGPMVWKANELYDSPTALIEALTPEEVDEIRSAIIFFKLRNIGRDQINQETFPLSSPHLTRKLRGLSGQVHNGRGIAILRGLDTARLNDEESVIAFVGVSSYVAPLRATDSYANQTLSHVRDATHDEVPQWANDLGLAGSKITSSMDFHSDRYSGDILALHVRDDGGVGNGGEQYCASSWKIYNHLLEHDSAVLETLAKPNWPFELKSPDNPEPYLEEGPVLFFAQGKPIFQLVKAPLVGSPRIPRHASMPALTSEQTHALHVFEELARRFSAKIDRQKGDIQFINNLSIMHARSAYGKPGSNERSTRHLLRMFLRDPANAWAKPASYPRFDAPFEEGREQNLPIVDLDPWRKISGMESHG